MRNQENILLTQKDINGLKNSGKWLSLEEIFLEYSHDKSRLLKNIHKDASSMGMRNKRILSMRCCYNPVEFDDSGRLKDGSSKNEPHILALGEF
jgi:hypothetical protein